MSGFANALRAFQADRLTRDQLLGEVYRSLAVERTSPVQLRVELGEANLRDELEPALRSAILERLASWDQTVRLWETDSGKELGRLGGGPGVDLAVFSPDGRYLATSGGGAIRLWELARVGGYTRHWRRAHRQYGRGNQRAVGLRSCQAKVTN